MKKGKGSSGSNFEPRLTRFDHEGLVEGENECPVVIGNVSKLQNFL
jgi:hypothetical protein